MAGLRTAWELIGWAGIAFLLWLSLTPSPPQMGGFAHADKIGHALAYALLMVWFAQLRRTRPGRAATALGLLALGVGIEFAQDWGGAREFSRADMVADLAGIALGWWAAPPRGPDLLALGQRVVRAAS
ncbi:MAG: VanZ family protein [Burkholderiales bacterium]|nr:VanZ family protein [Burkholderiales bacterium]